MTLSDEHRKIYEQSLKVAREEIEELNREIDKELAAVRERLIELESSKRGALQVYAAACNRLGIPNDLAEEETKVPDPASATRQG